MMSDVQLNRRVRQTRRILQQAFIELVQEKGFAATTVQDIVDRANFNRGTFYLHFADKYALTTEVMREQFRLQIADAIPAESDWNRDTARRFIHAILKNLEQKYRHERQPP